MKQWIPMDRYHISGVRAWLDEQAVKGQKLVKMGHFFATFEEKTEKRLAYHVEPKTEQEERKTVLAELGWEYVTDMGRSFAVYASTRKTLRYPPLADEAVKALKKEQMHTVYRLLPGLLLLIFLIGLGCQLYAQELMLCALDDVMIGLYVILLIDNIWQIALAIRRRRFLKRLEAGQPTSNQKHHSRALTCILLAALLLMEGGLWIARQSASWKGPIAEATISYTSLQELEQEKIAEEAVRKEFANTAEFNTSFLVPVQYELRQSGETEKDTEPVLQMRYDEAVTEGLAAKLLEARITSMLRWNEQMKALPIEIAGADEAYSASYQHIQYLFLRRGKRVLSVFYMGDQELTERAEAFDIMLE